MPRTAKGDTTKILLKLNKYENMKVELYKTVKDFKTKQDAIRDMIREVPFKYPYPAEVAREVKKLFKDLRVYAKEDKRKNEEDE